MDVQLQKGTTNHYCFVTDAARIGRGKKANARGAILFDLAFVTFVPVKGGDGENVPVSTHRMTATELGAWWAANPEWRVVDV